MLLSPSPPSLAVFLLPISLTVFHFLLLLSLWVFCCLPAFLLSYIISFGTQAHVAGFVGFLPVLQAPSHKRAHVAHCKSKSQFQPRASWVCVPCLQTWSSNRGSLWHHNLHRAQAKAQEHRSSKAAKRPKMKSQLQTCSDQLCCTETCRNFAQKFALSIASANPS